MADWIVEPFRNDHDRSGFACGKTMLDEFIRTRVTQYEKRRLGKTFVAVPNGSKQVIGYYTLAAGAVACVHLPPESARKLPRHPIPVVLLARLAVDRLSQGRRLGEELLLDSLQRAFELSKQIGIYCVAVDAIDNEAVTFYQKYGFSSLVDQPMRLFLPIATIENLVG